MKQSYSKSCEEPLCAFCVSAAFFIRGAPTAEKTQVAPSRRQQFPFSIPSYSGLRLGRVYRNKSSANLLFSIADLLSCFKERRNLSLDEILGTIQNAWQGPEALIFRESDINMEISYSKASSREKRSPALQRRRLSVPETTMRKHTLALSSIQETKHFHWDKEVECSSDTNLSRKKDFNLIRKSTLLRRLWGENSKPKLSGSFQEWQHSYKKLSSTQSLNSSHSSPERLPSKFDPSSPRRKFSSSPNRLSSKYIYEDQSAFNSPKRKTTFVRGLSKTSVSQEGTAKYTCSSFTNVSDSNSDSAYSNSISNITGSLSSKFHPDENLDNTLTVQNSRLQDSAVQTGDVTNLNVISNVSLSQSTLDAIFKEVMKDVSKLPLGDISISTATVTSDEMAGVKIDKASRFVLDMHSGIPLDPEPDLDKFIISKVRTGSPYFKPSDTCQPDVPRFSAFPRTSSMEVNTSEEDKDESDSVSYVDSLEDFNSPRTISQDKVSSFDIAQLLPEGNKDLTPKKSSTFYIPVHVDNDRGAKTVSELLPLKVRERLNERQQKREEKSKQYRSPIQPTTSNVNVIKNTLNIGNHLPKKKTKPVLPSIASLKRSSCKERNDPQSRRKDTAALKVKESKSVKQSLVKDNESSFQADQSGYVDKKIEILEIMECIDFFPDKSRKSKIPIPVSSNGNKKTEFDKPTYLDLDNHSSDPKVDQLIANILIDCLNHDNASAEYQDLKNANIPKEIKTVPSGKKYPQKFDVIPEENHKQDKIENNNCIEDEHCPSFEKNQNLKQKNRSSSIPKGWVTVYTVHKDLETPESTSDEGKKYLMETGREDIERREKRERRYTEKNKSRDITNFEHQNDLFTPTTRHEKHTFGANAFNNSSNMSDSSQGNSSHRRKQQRKNSIGDWSVTVSGSNSYGQMAPDVEMRLKFPKKSRTRSSSSTEKENSQNSKCHFPKIDIDQKLQDFERQYLKENKGLQESLPTIHPRRNKMKKREGSVISMTPSVIVPRQTKTSTSRYQFSRPRERYSLPDVPSILNERQYFDIMKRIPELLAVTGRSISSERRSFEDR